MTPGPPLSTSTFWAPILMVKTRSPFPTTLAASIRFLVWNLGLLLVVHSVPARADSRIDYNRDIRPILSENCYACHGPDPKARKADLRLDLKEDAFRDRSGFSVIVAGDPASSELLERIATDDPDAVMPPPESGKALSKDQVELVRKWIAQGAPWDGHWAYIPPEHVAPPEVEDATWPRNAIDRFVLNRIEKEGLSPSPEADKATLIRRLSLDLTGLPPTPAEVDAFLADTGPAAYEKVVDRLLASPHYGERMAQDWLDLARYADTNGYHIDNNRDIWMYREWVIEAFNRNQPFDQFTVEQIAGDLLPNPTVAQRIATGFQRNTMVNFEGGADPDEYLTKYVVDRVNTTAAVYLGTTLACAECHDHKYDPFTQKDFYRFYAFFNTIDEKGLDGLKESPAPRLKVPTAEQDASLKEVRGQVSRLDDLLKGPLPSVDAAQAKWERDQAEIRKDPTLGWKVLEPSDLVSQNDAMLAKLDDHSVLAGGANPDADVFEVTAPTTAKAITALRLEALTHESLAHKGAARSENGNFVLTGFEVEALPGERGRADPQGRLLPCRGRSLAGREGLSRQQGDRRRPEIGLGRLRRQEARRSPGRLRGGCPLRLRVGHDPENPPQVRVRPRPARHRPVPPGVHDGQGPLAEPGAPAARSRPSWRRPRRSGPRPRSKEIRDYYRGTLSAEIRPFRDELAALRKAEGAIDRAIPTTMVMKEQEKPRETHILMRGDFRSKGEIVTPDVPQSLPRIPEGQPANRLGLARWLVDPGHPLVARVTVNRFWQHYFGVGLVKTSNDFGTQGEWPSHPDLLDWLATEFIASGWDVKALQKQIVMSATYRQSSKLDPAKHERDPENRLLARGPRFRLDAETIRDNALAVSGLLNPEMGGPSVFPYQPPGLWEELAFGGDFTSQSYTTSKGDDLYRRGLYTYWKRSLPNPSLTVFDAPNRELCTVQRPRTNTPLQALVLLNDPVYIEAARVLAQRTMKEGGSTPPDRLAYAFRLCTARTPSDRELDVLLRHYHQQLDNYRKDPKAAAALIRVGESPRPAGLDDAELAAWTAIGNILLNLDETITKG